MLEADNLSATEQAPFNVAVRKRGRQKIALIKQSGFFDECFYNNKYKWLAEQGVDSVAHYYDNGDKNDRTPNPYFYPGWYRKKYLSDRADINALCHYITEGRFKGFSPSPLFDPAAYIVQPGRSGVPLEDALLDWLNSDRAIAPPSNALDVIEYEVEQTGLFAASWYVSNYPQVALSGLTPLQHYARIGRDEGLKPNPYFDSRWYLKTNPHVQREGTDPLLHYARHGWRNGKDPSLWFTAVEHQPNDVDRVREPLNDYLRICLSPTIDPADCIVLRGSAHSRGVFKVPGVSAESSSSATGYRNFLGEPGFQLIRYYAGDILRDKQKIAGFCKTVERLLAKESMEWLRGLGCLETVASLFQPPDIESARSSEGNNVLVQFVSFLDALARQELKMAAIWFDADYFRRKTLKSIPDFECLQQWVLSRESDQFIPNSVFEADFYIKVCGIEFSSHRDALRHFLSVGLFRNIKFNSFIELQFIEKRLLSVTDDISLKDGPRNARSIFAEYLLSVDVPFSCRHQALFDHNCRTASYLVLSGYLQSQTKQDIKGRLLSGSLNEQIFAACKHDSKVVARGLELPLSCPPFNSQIAPVVRNIRRALPATNFDTVVLIPHCRMSGATKIAGRFMSALSQQAGLGKMLLVHTDLSVFEHPEWFPEDTPVLDLCDHTGDIPGEFKEMALLDLIIGVRARKVVNVNSRLGWQVFERYGERLATITNLYAYMFCYDLNKDFVKVGYPSEYFISTFNYMTKVFLDSDYLRQELISKNRLTEADQRRLLTLYTPVDTEGVREYSPAQSGAGTIFWAGRLDRQKNFDLVIDIARQMPDVHFECWGEGVIGDYVVDDLAANITLNKPFRSIEEIDMDSCDLWLYTSLWDGIPNLLLEVGLRGVPIVSSGVWGINDLLSDTNSRVVTDDISSADLYIKAIRKTLQERTDALARAGNLKELVLSRHNKNSYALAVREALAPDHHD